jgi:hypothetical protein
MVSFQQRLRDKLATITFTRIIAPDVPEVIMGDATRLLQLLSNLLSNSSKFTPEGGRITLTVDVTHTPPKGLDASASSSAAPPPPPEAWLRFQVQDTGVGIAKGACCAAQRVPPLPSVATLFCVGCDVVADDGHATSLASRAQTSSTPFFCHLHRSALSFLSSTASCADTRDERTPARRRSRAPCASLAARASA